MFGGHYTLIGCNSSVEGLTEYTSKALTEVKRPDLIKNLISEIEGTWDYTKKVEICAKYVRIANRILNEREETSEPDIIDEWLELDR